MKPKITIVMPVYHEKENVQETLEWIDREVRTSHEVLVVYDMSDDPTLPVIKRLIKAGMKKVKLVKNSGKGVVSAMKTGFLMATGEVVTVIAADGTDDPTIVDKMYSLIEQGYKIVSATRYDKGGKLIAPKTGKLILSRVANYLSPVLTGVKLTDLTYAYKMYDKKLLSKIEIESTGGFEYGMELTLKAVKRGVRIAEVPVTSIDRQKGKSKFSLARWLRSYLKWYLLGIWWRLRG